MNRPTKRTSGARLVGLLALLWLGLALIGPAHAGTTYYYYTDAQGTVLAKADAQGNIVARYDYKPYGAKLPGPQTKGPTGYTGHVNDAETGLVYMQARYYDPVVGRFLSVDPVGPKPGDGFNFNRYAYGNNNPILNIDPLGMQACEGVSGCMEARHFDPTKADGKTATQDSHADNASKAALPGIETKRNTERGVRFDESSEGVVTTTEVPVETTATKTPNGIVYSAILHKIKGATAIGHSHPNKSASIAPGPHDDGAVNEGMTNNIVNNGNIIVVEKVNGQFRVRILSNVHIDRKSRKGIQGAINSYQKRLQDK